jgi:hypothetical protein
MESLYISRNQYKRATKSEGLFRDSKINDTLCDVHSLIQCAQSLIKKVLRPKKVMAYHSLVVVVSLFSPLICDDVVQIKVVISESFNPPAFGNGRLLGALVEVLGQDEVPLVRFVRQDKPLKGPLRFLLRLHLFLSPP